MGPELAIAMAVGGKLMEMQATQEQASERRNVLNQQLERDDKATGKAIQLVKNEGQNYDVQNRQDAIQKQEDKTYNQINTDMQGAGGGTVNTSAGDGNFSEDFLKTKAARAVDEGTRLTAIAREAAKSRSPGQIMTSDALRRAGMAGDLQNLWGSNNNMAHATGQDADAVTEPGYGALGSVASALGTGMAMNSYGKTGGVAKSGIPVKYSGSPIVSGIAFG